MRRYYYDCSFESQGDKFVTTSKAIIGYVGREYTYGGDIRATLENMTPFMIPTPSDPAENYK